MHNVRQFPITVKDLMFDRNTGKFYASIPSGAGAMGNSIAKIDPATGQVESFVFIGSEPGKLALSDDGHTLYVSLEGAGAVRKFDITTQTAGEQFALGDSTSNGPFFVNDLAVAPGQPNVVAVSRKNMTSSPNFL
jgi:DNA-binding beta-propeller fold protein YncE